MIEAILLDLDGVLVHTDEFHYLAWQALARRLGIPFTRAQGDRCRGVSRMESLDIVLEGADRTFTAEEKADLTAKMDAVREALKGTDLAAIKAKQEELQKAFYAVSEKLYANAQAAQQAAQGSPNGSAGANPGAGSGKGDDGYVDADFKEV